MLFTTVHNQSINDNDTDTDNNNISAKLSYMKLCHEDSWWQQPTDGTTSVCGHPTGMLF